METELIDSTVTPPLRIVDSPTLPDVERIIIERTVREHIASMREPMPPPTIVGVHLPQRDRATFKLLLSWNLLQIAVMIGVGVWVYVTLTSFTNAVLNAPANLASSAYHHVPSWLGGPADPPRQ